MMRTICTAYILLLLVGITQPVAAQHIGVAPAEFDVIVKTNGEIITGKVIEVGIRSIRFKRTDIPDGPIYEVRREEVYAISYRNQLKEYITPVDSTRFAPVSAAQPVEPSIEPDGSLTAPEAQPSDAERWHSNIRYGEFRPGVGFIRGFSKIDNADELTNESSGPGLFLTYLFPYKKNISFGLLTGFASFKYSDVLFSAYDELQIERKITENLFTVAVMGKYALGLETVDPYIMGGLSFNSSNVSSDGSITFVDDERTIKVQNSARSSSLGLLFRIGFNVRFSEKFGAYADFGNGLTLVQIGGILKINEK
jgi:hypothetical protein